MSPQADIDKAAKELERALARMPEDQSRRMLAEIANSSIGEGKLSVTLSSANSTLKLKAGVPWPWERP